MHLPKRAHCRRAFASSEWPALQVIARTLGACQFMLLSMRTLPLVLLTCTLCPPAGLYCQELPRFVTSTVQPGQRRDAAAPILAFGHPADYRTEGIIAGAVLIGVPTAILAFSLCADTDSGGGNCLTGGVGVSLLGFALGGLTGALIGGAIPKAKASTTQGSGFRQAPNAGFLLSGCAPGGVLTRVAGSCEMSLTHSAAGEKSPAAEAQSR